MRPPSQGTQPPPGGQFPPAEDLTDRIFRYGVELVFIVLGGALWLVCSLPIVTLPAATVGLYTVLIAHVADGDRHYVKPFFTGFRASFRSVTVPGLVMVGLVGLTGFNAWYYAASHRAGQLSWVLAGIQAVLCAAIALGVSLYFALAGRWVGHDSARRADRPSFLAGFRLIPRHPWWSLAALAAIIGVPAIFIWLGMWQLMVFMVGVIAYIVTWAVAKACVWRAPRPRGGTPGRVR